MHRQVPEVGHQLSSTKFQNTKQEETNDDQLRLRFDEKAFAHAQISNPAQENNNTHDYQ